MVATLMREYVKKNEQWLGNGDYISMGNDMNPDCKGTCLNMSKMVKNDQYMTILWPKNGQKWPNMTQI